MFQVSRNQHTLENVLGTEIETVTRIVHVYKMYLPIISMKHSSDEENLKKETRDIFKFRLVFVIR